jgi:hypothetical protein
LLAHLTAERTDELLPDNIVALAGGCFKTGAIENSSAISNQLVFRRMTQLSAAAFL